MKLISENPKASLTTAVGALVVILVFILGQFGIEVPEAVQIAAGVLIVWLVGYFSRLSKSDAAKLEAVKNRSVTETETGKV